MFAAPELELTMDLLRAPQADPSLQKIIPNGLPHARRKAHVIIAGAGMAGLVAGYELDRAGHKVTLLEARHRVGGRVWTVRDRFSDGLAAEMGAMRIPTAHGLTMAYIAKFGLPTVPFQSNNDAAYSFIHGVRRRLHEPLDDAFALAAHERGLGLGGLLARSLSPLIAKIEAEGAAGWAAISETWATTSLRDFLLHSGWSDGAIDMFGILARHETLMDTSFLEFFRGNNDVASPMVRILGGMDRLPNAYLATLEPHVRYGASIHEIEQGSDFVRVHYQNAAGHRSLTGDYLICTLPYSILRFIEVTPELSIQKQRAIRQIHYDSASKIFLQFRRRFWEDEGIAYGSTVTDLPIRNVIYPASDHNTSRGLVIASYTWAQDALRWAVLPEHERVAQALENFARIHPRANEYFEVGATHAWQNDPFSGGAYTVFQPGQQQRLHRFICMPEGRVHFAGEHASLLHRWVEGAVESGLRAALEVSLAAQKRAALDPIALVAWKPMSEAGGTAFALARRAVLAGDTVALSAILGAHPEVVHQHVPTSDPPFDGAFAWSTLLHCAIADPEGAPADPVPIVRLLLEDGADVNALCGGGPARPALCGRSTPLTLAAGRPNAEALMALLHQFEADVDEAGGRPLHRALCGPRTSLVANAAFLRQRGARVDLAFAAGLGDVAAVSAWLSPPILPEDAYCRFRPEADRLDVGDRGAVLAEALVFAAQAGAIATATLLLNAGADPSALVSIAGIRRTALHAAAQSDDAAMVSLLLSRGANPSVADSEWASSALSWAVIAKAARVIAVMRAAGHVLIDDLVYFGTPGEIALALAGRHPDRAQILGAPGVLLRNAALAGRDDVCELLVTLGADPALTSPIGLDAAEVAARSGHTALAERLRAHVGSCVARESPVPAQQQSACEPRSKP